MADTGTGSTTDTGVAETGDTEGGCVPAAELCDGRDGDCDGLIDGADPDCQIPGFWLRQATGPELDQILATHASNGAVAVGGYFDTTMAWQLFEPIATVTSDTDQAAFVGRLTDDGELTWIHAVQSEDPESTSYVHDVTVLGDGGVMSFGCFTGNITVTGSGANEVSLAGEGSFQAHHDAAGSLVDAVQVSNGGCGTKALATSEGTTFWLFDLHIPDLFGSPVTIAPGTAEAITYDYEGTHHTIALAAFAPSHTLAWSTRSIGQHSAFASDMTLTPNGGPAIAGWYLHGVAFSGGPELSIHDDQPESFAYAFSASGTPQWGVGAGHGGPDYAERIAIGTDGSVTIAGRSNLILGNGFSFGAELLFVLDMFGGDDIYIAHLDPGLALDWIVSAGSDNYDDVPRALFVDTDDRPCLAGRSPSSLTWPGDVSASSPFVACIDSATETTLIDLLNTTSHLDIHAAQVTDSGGLFLGGSFWDELAFESGSKVVTVTGEGTRDGILVRYETLGL